MSTRRLLPVFCLLVAAVTVVMTSCKDDDVNAEPVEIIRLDKVMLGYSDYDSAGRAKVRSRYAPAIKSMCRVLEMDSCGDADLLLWNGNVMKLITSVLVVIVNYVISKLLVFRK